MDDGATTVGFVRTLARAEARSGNEEWEEAARLWTLVVAANPVEGRFWGKLAEARQRCEDFAGAIAASEQALALRDGFPAETLYRIACCQARLGEREQALASFERALVLGYRRLEQAADEEDLAPLREDARFRELVGLVDDGDLSRDERWRRDLRFLVREIRRRAYDPFRHVPETRFDAAVAELDGAIPNLSDLQVIVAMNALLRPLGDGHAWVWPADEDEEFCRRLPVQLFHFAEGLFVIAAAPGYEALLGAEVVRFGERPVAEAMAAVDAIVHRDNENSQWPKFIMPRLLRIVPLLHSLGIASDPHTMTLTIRDLAGETRQVSLPADAMPPNQRGIRSPGGWSFYPETLETPLPLYLRNLDVSYWFAHLHDQEAVYVQWNAVQDDPPEAFSAFTDRLFAFIEGHRLAKLAIDLRWNSGGNTFLAMPFLHRLIGSTVNRRGALFVIIGRATFSAAQNITSYLDRHTEAVFVGEPTGSSPTFVGETVEFALPYSKASVNVSDLLWSSTWPMDYRSWIAPTLYTPPTFAAFRANRDPALEAILALEEHLPGW